MKTLKINYLADCGYIDFDLVALEVIVMTTKKYPLEIAGYEDCEIPDDMDDWSEDMMEDFDTVMNRFKKTIKIVEQKIIGDGNKYYNGTDVPDPCPIYELIIELQD